MAPSSLRFVQRQELDVLESGRRFFIGHDDRNGLGHTGKDLRRRLKDIVHVADPFPEPPVDEGHVVVRQGSRFQGVDVQAIGRRRRNATGGRVRLLEVSEQLQITHLVADRGRAEAQIVLSGNRSRTDRFRRFDIVFDDDLQDFSFSVCEHNPTSSSVFQAPKKGGAVLLALILVEC